VFNVYSRFSNEISYFVYKRYSFLLLKGEIVQSIMSDKSYKIKENTEVQPIFDSLLITSIRKKYARLSEIKTTRVVKLY